MSIEVFSSCYRQCRDDLGKKLFSDGYISTAATKMNVEHWDDETTREVFRKLSLGNPYKIDISAEVVRMEYWNIFRLKMSQEKYAAIIPCKKGLCDGKGVVITKKMITQYGYEVDYCWRCQCILGQGQPPKIPIYREMPGHKIDKDNIYTEAKYREDLKFNNEGGGYQYSFDDETNRISKSKAM